MSATCPTCEAHLTFNGECTDCKLERLEKAAREALEYMEETMAPCDSVCGCVMCGLRDALGIEGTTAPSPR